MPPPAHYILRAYIPDDERAEQTQSAMRVVLAHYPVEQPVFRTVAEQDWSEAWKAHYHPLRVGKRFVIRPLWEQAELSEGDIEIALDPGMAFGTGTHPTTQLCLAAAEDLMLADSDVLDLGCGSAILAIGAAKLGARRVFAIDIDPVAVESAENNLRQNGVEDIVELTIGGLRETLALGRAFDFALVNILARIIIPMAEEGLGEIVKPGGIAVFSGLIESQRENVETALTQAGFEIVERRHDGEWVLLVASRAANTDTQAG